MDNLSSVGNLLEEDLALNSENGKKGLILFFLKTKVHQPIPGVETPFGDKTAERKCTTCLVEKSYTDWKIEKHSSSEVGKSE